MRQIVLKVYNVKEDGIPNKNKKVIPVRKFDENNKSYDDLTKYPLMENEEYIYEDEIPEGLGIIFI